MLKEISRKSFLREAPRYVAGAVVGLGVGQLSRPGGAEPRPASKPLPWPYQPLDPETVRKTAHDGFYEHGCGHAGFAGILRHLVDKVGEPFSLLPLEMMGYASGGIKAWGTVCGALNGACAAIGLVCDSRTAGRIIDELMLWYTQSPLPGDISNGYAEKGDYGVDKKIPSLPQSISGSPLCHISTTRWCVKAGYTAESAERFERCARLSGDVAAKAVALLNDQAAGRFTAVYTLPEAASGCLACHGPKGEVRNVAAKLDCTQCHDDPAAHK